MLIVFHVFIAVSGLISAGILYLKPSKLKLFVTYLLTGITIISGTVLIFQNRTHMVEACTLGLIYLGIVLFSLVMARRKLAAEALAIV